ncbi:MAG TPA: GGDEF domain-containing protein [Paucimonas sp.]|nr:GGDEF domain-containing protein [Paucimonas sp.]
MDNLLTHLVEITGHRDHTLLDISTLSALHELVGAREVRTLELFRLNDEWFLRQRVSTRLGKVTALEEDTDTEHAGEPVARIPGLQACIEERRSHCDRISADGSHTLWFPIWINDKTNTCVEVSSDTRFSTESMKVIEGILSVYRNYQSLLDYSERDSLTGLLNRKTFDEKFARMLATAPQIDNPPPPQDREDRRQPAETREQWLAVIDIDHFKKVNDRFGHLYGDEVLILVANLLRSSFRAQDRVFRFGGEEFVVLLRTCSLDDARRIFERFRGNIEQHEFPQVGRVTVSIGFAGITNETPVVILGHADQALYYAKANGRNQVCHYDELLAKGLLQSGESHESAEFFFDLVPVPPAE